MTPQRGHDAGTSRRPAAFMMAVLRRLGPAFLLAVAMAGPGGGAHAAPKPADPLAVEIERWAAFLKDNPAKDEDWIQIRDMSGPIMERVTFALKDGRRLLALQRLAVVRNNLAASAWVAAVPEAERTSADAFEAAWKRMGETLKAEIAPPRPGRFDDLRPAALRGLAEVSASQVRIFYNASLNYGRNTTPQTGMFYLGAAQAASDFAAFCRTLSKSGALGAAGAGDIRKPPPLRSLAADLDALEARLLETYRPPVSIDRHTEFILASSALNEARELDAAGLRPGALLRYLDATLRTAGLRAPEKPLEGEALEARLKEIEGRVDKETFDRTIGRVYLESARANLAPGAPGANPSTAASIATQVLPAYFAALGPPPPRPARPAPTVTVTLVRWPFT